MSVRAEATVYGECDGCNDGILDGDDVYCSACAGRGKGRGERRSSDDLNEAATTLQHVIHDLRRAGTDERHVRALCEVWDTLVTLAPPVEPPPASLRLVVA